MKKGLKHAFLATLVLGAVGGGYAVHLVTPTPPIAGTTTGMSYILEGPNDVREGVTEYVSPSDEVVVIVNDKVATAVLSWQQTAPIKRAKSPDFISVTFNAKSGTTFKFGPVYDRSKECMSVVNGSKITLSCPTSPSA